VAAYKPELLTTAGSLHELERLIEAGADAVNIGEHKYGLRLPGEFTLEQVGEAVKLAHAKGAKIYVSVNNIMDNEILADLPDYLRGLEERQVDAIVFGDPAVLMAAKQFAPGVELHWSTEMTSTNYATANFWAGKGAKRVIVARELNLEEIHQIKRHVHLQVQVQAHGLTNIYHSKRNLVQSYMEHQGQNARLEDLGAGRGLFLIEAERQDEKFPIYEDRNGTHIMSSDDICMIENLHELLEEPIDSLKIEGLLKSAEYNEVVVRAYRQAIDAYAADPSRYIYNEDWLEGIRVIQQKEYPDRELSFGFFYKEQVY
jgi:putative protease